jgi:hypothetical protein
MGIVMERFVFAALLLLSPIAYGVCLNPPGVPSLTLEDVVEEPTSCAADDECVVLGCFAAYNQTAARYAHENPGHWYAVNCDRSVHDEVGQCVLRAKCEESRCVIAGSETAIPHGSE